MDSIFGFDVQSIIPRKMFQNGKFASKPIQSVCYDEKNKRFIVGFSHKSNSNGTLVQMSNLDFSGNNVIKVKEDIAIGHCNDMVYHSKQHKIYVARGDKKLAVVNPDTLAIEKYVTLDMTAWQISLYSDGSWFISDSDVSVKYNSYFKNPVLINNHHLQDLIDTIHMPYDSIDKNYAGDWQGSVMINDVPYLLYNEWNGVTDSISGDTRYKSCVLYSPVDRSVRRFPTFMEVEDACLVGNRMYFVLGNEYIGSAVYDLDCKEIYFNTAKTVHKELDVNSDLNMIFTPNTYRCKNAKKAKTIQNLPDVSSVKDAGFTLQVDNTGLNHIRQTIYSNNFWTPDVIFTRGYSLDAGWGDWYCYSLDKAQKNSIYKTVFGKFENVTVPTGNLDKGTGGNFTLDFKQFVPDGYTLYAANIDVQYGNTYYTLPFVNDSGRCSLHIQRILDNKITIRSHDNWGKCTFWVTGFCKRI